MTADTFRKDPGRVAQMRPILEMPIMKEWLDCVMRSSPANVPTVDSDISPTAASIEHGTIKGFHLFHTIFSNGGSHLVPPQPVNRAAMELEEED